MIRRRVFCACHRGDGERARTPRERLRALEQVRSATKLRLRDAERLDGEDRGLLDGNLRQAEEAYRSAPDFETATRGLSGWREAITQRLDAAGIPEPIDVPVRVMLADGRPVAGRDGIWRMSAAEYWRAVPRRLRDHERYVVSRAFHLSFGGTDPETVKVFEAATGGLVWAKPRQP